MIPFRTIENFCRHKKLLPGDAPLEALMCYTCMESLYRNFREKRPDPAQALEQKRMIRAAYENACDLYAEKNSSGSKNRLSEQGGNNGDQTGVGTGTSN